MMGKPTYLLHAVLRNDNGCGRYPTPSTLLGQVGHRYGCSQPPRPSRRVRQRGSLIRGLTAAGPPPRSRTGPEHKFIVVIPFLLALFVIFFLRLTAIAPKTNRDTAVGRTCEACLTLPLPDGTSNCGCTTPPPRCTVKAGGGCGGICCDATPILVLRSGAWTADTVHAGRRIERILRWGWRQFNSIEDDLGRDGW